MRTTGTPIIKVKLIDQDLIWGHKITEDLQIMLFFFFFVKL